MRFFSILFCCVFLYIQPVFAQHRSFSDLFPQIDNARKEKVFSENGLFVSQNNSSSPQLLSPALANTSFQKSVAEQKPVFLMESLMVIPFSGNKPDILAIYNACGRVRNLKGRLYYSFTRDKDVPLFEDATRIKGPKRISSIPDPPDVLSVPQKETMYIRLKDANFGNSYYQADISVDSYGLVYRLTNFRSLSYLFIPAIQENKFTAQLYIEPLAEGILIYSLSGIDVSDFIASRIDIPSAIRKRLEVIIDWISEGIQDF
jgi:hypothetical protein